MTTPSTTFSRLATLLCAGLLATGTALAQAPAAAPTAVPTLAEFFKRAQYTEMVPSPNGRYLASTSSLQGRLNLVVIDLQERKGLALTNYDNIDVGRIRWVGNDYLLFSAIQVNAPSGQDSPRAGGLFSVAMDGSGVQQLVKTASQFARSGLTGGGFVDMRMLARVPNSKDEILAEAALATDDSYDVYRVNIANGKYRLLTQGRPSDRIARWILDSKQVPRLAVARGPGGSTQMITYYRSDADAPWQVINRFDVTAPPAFVPLGFEKGDKTLLVASNEGRKNMAIYRYDPEKKAMGEMIAQHPQYDLGGSPQGEPTGSIIGGSAASEDDGGIAGIRIDGDKPQTVWLDSEMGRIQASLDSTLRGRTNVIVRTASTRFLVSSYSDTSPGRYYLYDDAKRNLEEIGAARPWLEGKLTEVKPFMLKTRDGLEIPSYVVLPKGYTAGTKLPTIVHIHGGPAARDVVQGGRFGASFGAIEAQVLASRGYAVVLPNFRITTNIGSNIYYAGFGTYGRQMSDDHEDAAKWAVDQGFADPKRICISGASYGGYASLHTITRPTNPFACAIAGLPVADIPFQQSEADYAESKFAIEFWRRILGAKDNNDPLLKELSPITHADKIKVPVFFYVGSADVRTPPKQAERMADAMRKAGNPPKGYFIGKDEGHGYGVEANNVALYEQILKFLEASIGK